MADGEDLIVQLPLRLIIYILELLDVETLFNCIHASRDWDEITDFLQPRIWFKACVNAGIHVEENRYRAAKEWKSFFRSMVLRLRDMKVSNCYEIFFYTFERPIDAISFHNKKLAVAFGDYVVIMDTSHNSEEYDDTFRFGFGPSFLKYEGNTLVAAATCGHTSCWSLALEKESNDHNFLKRTFLSFDVLTDYSIMVGSVQGDDSPSIIYIWTLFGKRIFNRINVNDTIIQRVLLAPNVDSPGREHQKKTCFLFGLAEDCVRVWIVEIQSLSFSAQLSTTFTIPPDPNIHGDVDDTPPFGFLFDGTELFIMTPSPGRSPRIIWAWNFREGTKRYLESSLPIINLLGVGEKYLLYKLRNRDDSEDTVCAVDKITNEYVAKVAAPRIDPSNSLICLGDTSWMDGLNGENDSGVVFASVKENGLRVDIVKFVPRSFQD